MDYFGLRPHQMGVGNIYYVIQATHGEVAELTDYQEKTYLDGSSAVHATVATALTASQAERNDYIICRPDNDFYATSATLTMDKNDVHLIAPDGFGKNGMANFRTVLQETGSYSLATITGHGVEIAGFFFAGKQDKTILDYGTGTVWTPFIHDNYFGMNASTAGSGNYGLSGTGAINNYCIRDNTFSNFSPGSATGTTCKIAAFINIGSESCTRGVIRGNIMHTGYNTTVAAGIIAGGFAGMIIDNYLWEDTAIGGCELGVFTKGILVGLNNFIANNRIGMIAQANAISGASAEAQLENYAGNATGGELFYAGLTT